MGLQDKKGPGSASPLLAGIGHDWKTPHHFLIVTADVTLGVGCIDRYVINMYCASHNF